MSRKKTIIGAVVAGFVIIGAMSGNGGDNATAAAEATSKPTAITSEPTITPEPTPDLAPIQVHLTASATDVGSIFTDMTEAASDQDLDGIGDHGQRLADWASDEREYLRSTEFPECTTDLITRWTSIVDLYGDAGDLAVDGADDVDVDALTESADLMTDATSQVTELTNLLPSIFEGC